MDNEQVLIEARKAMTDNTVYATTQNITENTEPKTRTPKEKEQQAQDHSSNSQDVSLGHDVFIHSEGHFNAILTHSDSHIGVQSQDEYLDNMFSNDIQRFQSYSNCLTGYSNLDKAGVRVYPGLYAVGGISSVGKTTFCLQLADQLAQQGRFVLFFSLEQSRFDLTAKSIARLAKSTSATSIKNGHTDKSVQKAIDEYRSFAKYISFVEGIFALTVDNIIDTVKQFCNHKQQSPVVFIDYLQAIRHEDSRGAKDDVGSAVRKLKQLSVDLNIPVFVISSFNRSNYLSVADYESFKESGDIEYTADAVFALQLAAMNATIFNAQGDLQIKRKFVQLQKSQNPRDIELLVLKTRFSKPYSRYFFQYSPQWDYFVPRNINSDDEIADLDDELIRKAEKFKAEYAKKKEADSSGKMPRG